MISLIALFKRLNDWDLISVIKFTEISFIRNLVGVKDKILMRGKTVICTQLVSKSSIED